MIQSPSFSRTWRTFSLLPSGSRAKGRSSAPTWTASGAVCAVIVIAVLLCRSAPGCQIRRATSPGLPRDRLRRLLHGLGIAEVARTGGSQVLVELVHQGDAGRDVETDDVVVGDAVEVLHQRPQRVAVRGDQ